MESTSTKRSANGQDDPRAQKRTKLNGAGLAGGGGSKTSFASRMMTKMGYQKGQGLGKEGTGIVNPIEVKLRPQGAGVGSVSEKTPQAKADARRAAQQRGEDYEGSSEEERRARRKKKDARILATGSGRQTPIARAKPRIRTAAEIEAEEGLHVPESLKSLIDYTGQQPQMLTSAAGLMSASAPDVGLETAKIATYARRELEAFVVSWHTLKENKDYAAKQATQLQEEIEHHEADLLNLKSIGDAMNAISMIGGSTSMSTMTAEEIYAQLEELTSKLEEIQMKFTLGMQQLNMAEIAVAALQPLFKKFMSSWNPFANPLGIVPQLVRLKGILGINQPSSLMIDGNHDISTLGPSRLTTPYESLVYTQWLPKIRTLVVNEWDPTDPAPMLLLVSSWKEVLPSLAYDTVVNQLVVQRLSSAIKAWKPHATRKGDIMSKEPHMWIFPWLEHLDEYHLDPKSSNGLLAEMKRKFRTAFSTWDPAKGVIEGIDKWQGLHGFRNELNHALDMNMIPRLVRFLDEKFEVDPSDQDVTPIEKVLLWSPSFAAEKFSRIVTNAFFPKWLNVLHLWLTSEPDYDEISEWCSWWQNQFPPEINEVGAVSAEWEKGLTMINQALDLGPEAAKGGLAPPKAGPARPIIDPSATSNKSSAPRKSETIPTAAAVSEVSFKDLLEELCEKESLLLVPTRKAHPVNGLPLFKITASASGSGGVQVYLKGDIVWAQSRKDRLSWEPVDIFEDGLITALAEGR